MVKHSLNKLLVLLGLLALFWTYPVAAESYSDLYIKITDATTAVQNKDQAKAKELVAEIKTDFETKENHDSKAGKKVSKAFNYKKRLAAILRSASLMGTVKLRMLLFSFRQVLCGQKQLQGQRRLHLR